MNNREEIRSEMNAFFFGQSDWFKQSFFPLRENLSLLFDKGLDELAREVVVAIPEPAGETEEHIAEFNQAKTGILDRIDLLIADFIANDPLRSPLNIAERELAEQRRNQHQP